MAIDAEWQDEREKMLARYEGLPLGLDFFNLAGPDSICLRFIEPWGDTIFNESQIKVVSKELRTLRQQTLDRDLADSLDAPIESIAQYQGKARKAHSYLKFIGD